MSECVSADGFLCTDDTGRKMPSSVRDKKHYPDMSCAGTLDKSPFTPTGASATFADKTFVKVHICRL